MMRTLKAAAAMVMLLALAVAPPWLLVRGIGNPWPDGGVSLTAPLTDEALLGLLATIVWVLWAQVVVCVLVEALAALTDDRIQLAAPLTLGVQRQLARRLVSAIVMATLATPLAFGSSTATATTAAATADGPLDAQTGAGRDTRSAQPSSTGASTASGASPAGAAQHAESKPDAQAPLITASERAEATVTVMRLDSLWSIAERVLGDGDRWVEIAELNEGRLMVDGTRFVAADQIRPGWQVEVPTPGAPQAGTASTKSASHMSHVVVTPGDTLSGIAADHLGDASAYPAIFEASRLTIQPDGSRLTDPDLIAPGWTLTIPGTQDAEGAQDAETDEAAPQESKSQAPAPPVTSEPDPRRANAPLTESRDRDAKTPPDGVGVEDAVTAATPGERAADEGAQQQAPWMLAGLSGGGAVLAGGMLLGVRARRRARARTRAPGRVLTPPPRGLVEVEKSLMVSGRAATQVEGLDARLRQMARTQVAAGEVVPDLAAVELSDRSVSGVVLHLAAPTRLRGPWRDDSGAGVRWSLDLDAEEAAEPTGETDETGDAPYPLLVTVGRDDAGAVWLLNLERLGHVHVAGDPRRGEAFGRYLIAEVAVNRWSQQAEVDCVGIGVELVPMSPHRIAFTDPADTASVDRVLKEVWAGAEDVARRAGRDAAAVLAGRTSLAGAEAWPARLLVIRGGWDMTLRTTQDLRAAITDALAATATALVVIGDSPDGATGDPEGGATGDPEGGATGDPEGSNSQPGAVCLSIDTAGRMVVDSFGLTLHAAGITEDEARGCAALMEHSETAEDLPAPAFEDPTEPWHRYATQTGALRAEHTTERSAEGEAEDSASSLLPEPDEVYLRDAAVIDEDLRLLAPRVTVGTRETVAEADPGLDADLDAWFDDNSRRPRLHLLGPVTARTYGKPLVKQRAYMTELLAYLALRRSTGATPGEVATAFSISPGKTREYVRVLRSWLGTNPSTGQPYLPHADKAPASQVRGVGVYQLDAEVLMDMDLFRRLRLRGESAGADGVVDLEHALLLVTGRPFDQLREGGWSWLLEGERLDHFLAPAVADVALIVVTHHLHRQELAKARAAAEIAILAAPDEEASRLSLSRVCVAEGNRDAADRVLGEDVLNRTDDDMPPADLSERTRKLLASHRRLAEASNA